VAGRRSNQSQARQKTPLLNIARASKRSRTLKSTLTVSELAERAGVSVPTIHSYRRLGLLPEPTVIAANRFLYDDRHVEALAMIRLLRRERNMSLAAIVEVLPDLLPTGEEEAFRPQMWQQVLDSYLETAAQSEPPARLLTAARDAFVQHGYAGVNIADLCADAEMATGSFYRHFQSKDAVFVAAVRSVADVVSEDLSDMPLGVSKARAIATLRTLLEPFIPLLLESVLREQRGARELADVMTSVTDTLAARLRPHLRSSVRSSAHEADLIVRTALLDLVQRALGFENP
jgi:AcrR family transcriptional regulator